MNTQAIQRTQKNFTISVFVVSLMFLVGCGQGGQQSIAPSAPSLQQEPDGVSAADQQEIYYDIDIEQPEGMLSARSASLSNETIVSHLTVFYDSISALPNSAFVKVSVNNASLSPSAKIDRLENIIVNIQKDIMKSNFKTAYKRIDRKLMPRIDGCNGGKPKNDYIINCEVEMPMFAIATEVKSALGNYKAVKPTDKAAFKNNQVNALQNILDSINILPPMDIVGPTGDPRGFLLEALTIATNYALDGNASGLNYAELKNVLMTDFVPYVDGLGNDDLILNDTARQKAFNAAMGIVNEVALISLTVSPAQLVLRVSVTQEFGAVCRYANNFEEDCTSYINWISSDFAVGTIFPKGAFTAVSAGTTMVSGEYEGVFSNNAMITVQ